jgi:redox-sensitive bicupin YhaK (pirin superfamily)
MTAGSGIIHQEMPRKYEGTMRGFQLWVNLPAKSKMIPPKYRGITGDQVPTVTKGGAEIKVVAGETGGKKGPVTDLAVDVEYFDVKLPPGCFLERLTEANAFVYVIEGSGSSAGTPLTAGQCALFDEGDSVGVATEEGIRFLFVAGEPLKEPVAWGGPIVMNTQEELGEAFRELGEGTFIKAAKGETR